MSATEENDDLTGAELKQARSRAYRLMGRTLKPRWPLVVATAATSILASLLEALTPLFLAKGIDVGLPALRDGDPGPLWLIVGLFAAASLVMGFMFWLSTWLTASLSQSSLMEIRENLFRKVQRLPVSFHEKYTSGRAISRQTSDMDALQEFLDGGVSEVLTTLLYLVFSLGLILALDPQSGIVIAVFLVVVIWLMRWFMKRAEKAFRESRTHSARLIVTFVETFTGIRAVQSFRKEASNEGAYSSVAADYQRATMNTIGLFGILQPLMVGLGNLCMVAVLAWGGWRAIDGTLSLGALVAVTLATKRLFGPMQSLLMYISSLQSAQSALEKVSGLLEEPETLTEPERPAALGSPHGEIVFDDVAFGYSPQSTLVEHLSLRIPAGQTVAVVGQTGAGKSTLAKLISRFYDVTQGSIRLDGTDVREIADADLRRRVVMVTQEAYLFSGTVAENIAIGKPDATREEVEAAAAAVGADAFIRALPDGYDTDVTKRGGRVSAGQRQLISFARAFLADPAVLILDEATSSLDLPSERLVQQGLERLLGERTALIIAHRLSTVAIADRVLVVRGGRVAEDGTPEELIAQGGEFAGLDAAWQRSLA
ncbi:ABC transporter ATP-binding protein [Falsarthrobacter nasiphocae]|uniref:ATP-binding cassette subfamily B protein n=1 Tax=Falsarthrobacter nasiphocae TaxID=189863 RepID=A0AAE3YGI1_9MICC|nr:ABC transporter ATP-binding protein [Falsarthrobacter nasiphocae]MDR6892337.1 ATP-binding cassette subfamily B protein [Falsarthrobacter nasiphocae]